MRIRLSFSLLCAVLVSCGNGPRFNAEHPLEADPAQVDFGYTAALDFSPERIITLLNTGTAAITIQTIRMAESDGNGFALQLLPPVMPYELPAGESEDISAYFTPVAADEYLGWIEVHTSADQDGPFLIPLGGCSTQDDCTVTFVDPPDGDDDDGDDDDDDDSFDGDPAIELDPVAMDFGEVAQNQSALGDVLVINNAGGAPLIVDEVSISGDEEFTIAGFTGGTINPGGAPANLTVTFDPYGADMGAHSATIVIDSNDPDQGTLSVTLTADVTEDCGACLPELAVAGAVPIDLAPLSEGDLLYVEISTGTVFIEISNIGYGSLPISPVTEGGEFCTDHPAFSYISGAPSDLGPGESATLEFTVGQAGLEVINLGGSYGFTMGTLAGDLGTLIGHLTDGSSVNCSLGL
jgi:hypothetical protein